MKGLGCHGVDRDEIRIYEQRFERFAFSQSKRSRYSADLVGA
jgi:hypothetical protein